MKAVPSTQKNWIEAQFCQTPGPGLGCGRSESQPQGEQRAGFLEVPSSPPQEGAWLLCSFANRHARVPGLGEFGGSPGGYRAGGQGDLKAGKVGFYELDPIISADTR